MFTKGSMEGEATTRMWGYSFTLPLWLSLTPCYRLYSASMVARSPPLGCMKNSPGLPIRVSLNQRAGVTMATHTRHFYQSTLSNANVRLCLRNTKSQQSPVVVFLLQVKDILYVLYIEMYTHNHEQSWIVKTRWTIPFSVQAFHTDGVRPDLYRESSWLFPGRYLKAGQLTMYCLSMSTHCMSYCREVLKHWGCAGCTTPDASPAIANTFMRDKMFCVWQVLIELSVLSKGHHLWFHCITFSV